MSSSKAREEEKQLGCCNPDYSHSLGKKKKEKVSRASSSRLCLKQTPICLLLIRGQTLGLKVCGLGGASPLLISPPLPKTCTPASAVLRRRSSQRGLTHSAEAAHFSKVKKPFGCDEASLLLRIQLKLPLIPSKEGRLEMFLHIFSECSALSAWKDHPGQTYTRLQVHRHNGEVP